MSKKNKLPTNEEIQNKLDGFATLVSKVVNNEVVLKTNKETITDKLELVRDQLLRLKDKAIPYSTLSKLLEDELGLKVSEQTLRSYCQTKLGFPKKGHKTTALKQPISIKNDALSQLSSDDEFI